MTDIQGNPSAGAHRYVDVGGNRTHYVVAGQGPPLVLLHGLGASHVAWQENVGPLSSHFTVYAVDIPGHGDSAKPNIPYSVDDGVAFLTGFLDAMALASAALAGNSMGGLIALRAALEHPRRVSHLVLVDTAGLGREVSVFLRLASLPILGEIIEQSSAKGTRGMLKVVLFDGDLITDGLVEELARARSAPGGKRAVLKMLRRGVGLRGISREHQLQGRIRELSMPVLLVWGEQDRIFPVAQARRAAQMSPSVRLVVYPECGHWPQMEHAAAFNSLLIEFLGQRP